MLEFRGQRNAKPYKVVVWVVPAFTAAGGMRIVMLRQAIRKLTSLLCAATPSKLDGGVALASPSYDDSLGLKDALRP